MKTVVGVDTHKDSHAIVIVDSVGVVLKRMVIRASSEGYSQAIVAVEQYDDVVWGIE